MVEVELPLEEEEVVATLVVAVVLGQVIAVTTGVMVEVEVAHSFQEKSLLFKKVKIPDTVMYIYYQLALHYQIVFLVVQIIMQVIMMN